MTKKKGETVTHRPKGNKKTKKDISKEPEMIELTRMIDNKELGRERVVDHIKKGCEDN